MTRRSRSSFDLRDALTTAEALSPKAPKVEPRPDFGGVPLVAFDRGSQAPPPGNSVAPATAPARVEPVVAVPAKVTTLGPPPDVTGQIGLVPQLGALLGWLRTDPGVTRALVVDDEGLPLVGAMPGEHADAESLLAATGSVASAMKRLAHATSGVATPGTHSSDFEGHVGDGPVLQLIGVTAGRRVFVVGISRKEPFLLPDVERVREAFGRALAGFLSSGSPGAGGVGRAGTP